MLHLPQLEGNGELGRGTESQASKCIKVKAFASKRDPKLTDTGQEISVQAFQIKYSVAQCFHVTY